MMDKVIVMKKSKSKSAIVRLALSENHTTSAGEQHYCAPPPLPLPLAHSPATLRTSLPKYVHKSTIRISL